MKNLIWLSNFKLNAYNTMEITPEKKGESLRIAVEKDILAFYNDEKEMLTARKKYQNSNYTLGIVIGVEKD